MRPPPRLTQGSSAARYILNYSYGSVAAWYAFIGSDATGPITACSPPDIIHGMWTNAAIYGFVVAFTLYSPCFRVGVRNVRCWHQSGGCARARPRERNVGGGGGCSRGSAVGRHRHGRVRLSGCQRRRHCARLLPGRCPHSRLGVARRTSLDSLFPGFFLCFWHLGFTLWLALQAGANASIVHTIRTDSNKQNGRKGKSKHKHGSQNQKKKKNQARTRCADRPLGGQASGPPCLRHECPHSTGRDQSWGRRST